MTLACLWATLVAPQTKQRLLPSCVRSADAAHAHACRHPLPWPARVRTVREALREAHRQWYLLRLCNLSTIMREWAALHALERLAFRGALLAAQPARRSAPASALVLPKARGAPRMPQPAPLPGIPRGRRRPVDRSWHAPDRAAA